MKRYSDREIRRIKELRRKYKYSYAYISRLSRIPQTTIGHWFRADEKIPKQETLLQHNIRNRQSLKKSEVTILRNFTFSNINNAKLWTAIFYWCEGSKYPSSNALRITNSDPNMLLSFITLLRKGFNLDEQKFYLHLQIHNNQNYKTLMKFWSDLLNVPKRQFIKPTITSPNGKKHRFDYKGTCTIKYQDYRLQLKLIGLYEEFAKKIAHSVQ